MANSNNQLKAYVRFDGTGRVIPGSLILQRSKPKVGNWQEIDATECCGYVPTPSTTTTTSSSTSTTTSTSTSTSTTTTTSTSTSTTTTTTTATPSYSNAGAYNSNDPAAACTAWTGGGSQAYYSSVQTPTIGTLLFENSNLTGPIADGYIAMIGKVFVTLNGAISSEYSTCP